MTDNWHLLDAEQALRALQSDAQVGLSDEEAARRLAQYGRNELTERGLKTPWQILWEQLTGIMVVILIVAAAISLALGEVVDALVIVVIVVLNALLGFTQEYRAEQAMAALKKMAVPRVKVRRGGHIKEIPAQELVPGDIVMLEAGSAAPADGRLVEAVNLRVQEAVLTGESEPVEKHTRPLDKEDLPVGDRINMIFMGSAAVYGRGSLVVTATGMHTQLGKIAEMLQSVGQEKTPLQKRLEQLSKGLAAAAILIVLVVFAAGLLRGEELRVMILTAISMAVAAVPEGLPAVVTIALALGAQRMLKRNALIRKLPAVETLGSVTVICSDKTGTLTQNRMTVTALDVAGNRLDVLEMMRDFSPAVKADEAPHPEYLDHPAVALLLAGGALCNDASLEKKDDALGGYAAVGDPTEGALVIAAAAAGLWKDDLDKHLPRTAELPFESERKRMTTVHRLPAAEFPPGLNTLQPAPGQTHIAFTKGSVDGLLEITSKVWVNGHEEPLNADWLRRIQEANNQMAGQGVRVLGVGFRLLDETAAAQHNLQEKDLVFVGMFGMIDPARPEVRQAVATTKTAGVRPIMITGDHPLTALSIAKDLGITPPETNRAVTGVELSRMSLAELKQALKETSVFARVSPEHKLKIVDALQDEGQVTAMTGDGVNDAPALKKADIGVAMGITGTDVSKESSDMVLLDDNFATIVAAVEEGRRIYDNIRKFIKYTMTSNAGEIWVMLLAPFLGMPLPLLPLQILWVNLVTDGLPGLALSVEPAEKDTMRRPPHSPSENIFGRGMARDILWIGLLMGLVSLGMGLWAFRGGNPHWQTMVFTTLTLSQMGNALATRSERYTLSQIGLLTNWALLGSVLLTFALQLAVIYTPFLQAIFATTPLPLGDLAISLAFSLIVFLAVEAFKAWQRRSGRN